MSEKVPAEVNKMPDKAKELTSHLFATRMPSTFDELIAFRKQIMAYRYHLDGALDLNQNRALTRAKNDEMQPFWNQFIDEKFPCDFAEDRSREELSLRGYFNEAACEVIGLVPNADQKMVALGLLQRAMEMSIHLINEEFLKKENENESATATN